jgi:pilus assembly protein CpaF
VDLFVQIRRFSDGTRKMSHVTECIGMEGELVTTQDLFVFDKTGITEAGKVTGLFRATGIRPTFNERLTAAGMPMPASVFQSRLEVK